MARVVVVTGLPAWAEVVEPIVVGRAFTSKRYHEPGDDVARLVDDGAVMLLVDGGQVNWHYWATVAKTSPATRRIPVVLVTDDDAVQAAAPNAGVDMVIAPGELAERLPGLLDGLARVPDAAAVEALACQCAEPLPPLAVAGIARFNAGDYYQQHDLFEELWMQESGPVRDLYRAILQVGIAYYQITRGNRRGAIKMLLRSVQWLALLPDECQGVDVAQLRADAGRVRVALEAADDLSDFDLSLLRPVMLVQ